MILVVLGTQDKSFSRLLKAVDHEIEKGTIKDKVIVQAGQTSYSSPNMEIFDLLPAPDFEKLMDEADLIITHGGAGSILSAIKKGKKIIAAARLEKYKEHHNDHQKQIIGEFSKQGYLLELKDFNKLGSLIEKSKTFRPKKFTSNTNHMIHLLDDYISSKEHISWFNRFYHSIQLVLFMIIHMILFFFCKRFGVNLFASNMISLLLLFFLFVLGFRHKWMELLLFFMVETSGTVFVLKILQCHFYYLFIIDIIAVVISVLLQLFHRNGGRV